MKPLSLLILLFSQLAFSAGHEGGNGGDPIRMEFIRIGEKILADKTQNIISLTSQNIYNEMKAKLTIENIKISDAVLIDNGNSVVSAIGNTKTITLYTGGELQDLSWSRIIENKEIRKKLVLHELFRLVDVDDDNYVYSNKIINPRATLDLSQGMDLPERLFPLSKAEMMEKGEQVDFPMSKCIESTSFRYEEVANIKCDQATGQCDISSRTNSSKLFEIEFKKTKRISRFLNDVNQRKTKGFISCLYTRGHDICNANPRKEYSLMTCSMFLSDTLLPSGYLSSLNIQHQGQQQQQNQQQQQQEQQQQHSKQISSVSMQQQ